MEAPRTECALKMEVSIPALASNFRIQRAIVDGDTGWCGLMYDTNSLFGLSLVAVLRLDVTCRYCLKHATGHNLVSSGKEAMMAETGSSGRVVLVFTNVKVIPSGDS